MTQCSGWQSPGWSNPNLLVNWDFRNPVNQRGQTSYTTETNIVYSLDCWQIGGNGSLNIEDGYIRVFRKIDFENMFQKIEKTSELAGKTITFSVCMGGQANMTLNVNNNYPAYAFKREEGIEIVELSYTLPEDLNNLEVIIQPPEDNTSFDLYAVKLEVGSISTLALDLMQPSDYVAELRKCQRYLQKHSYRTRYSGSANSTGKGVDISVGLAVPMRTTPTVLNFIPNFYRFHGNNYNPANPIIAVTNMETDVNEINIAIVDEGVFTSEARNPVSVGISKDFLISAEL